MQTIEKWGMLEISAPGRTEGNPFTDYTCTATFRGKNETVIVDGFYDGGGIYRARFMPSFEGEYIYEMAGSFGESVSGTFTVTAPAEDNHGPVRVVNQFHFAYEDTKPYYSVGTTCYAWAHQPEEVHRQTLEELDKGYFNKMRFCVFPKHYIHNFRDPETFPYEGTPVDNSDLCEENFSYQVGFEGNHWDFTRFQPEHFRRIERCIVELMDRGIEADIIVMHPYDRWGFSAMTSEQDDLYWNYVVARFAAYRNVWWSLANEYDLLFQKKLEDWERYARILCEKDPYRHLRSIHNCMAFYDHSRPWVTHCSLQRQDLYRHVEFTDEYRVRWGKPIVWDEISYEGNIDMGWGNISGQELTRRFWEAAMRGGYAGHGETFVDEENDILWWSHGGPLRGESPARIRFLHKILEETPGYGLRLGQGSFDETVGISDNPASFITGNGGYEIHYYGFGRPSFRDFIKPEGSWKVEIIDTWEMTVTDGGTYAGKFRVRLPGKEYMAVRLTRID
ncbi:DUF5605 domain-containing protein [Acutalibacter sp. 1XD8-33]|uniref:DUF5605 domain-containing protein n=1 Tax=Acutalibacter sp. 1XD8-33 TaxID=2320081 RepID=UPI001FAAACA3|nr:DUF5605 domain-containing protein [Acutalibacter sp. 1XD8-33]